MKEFSDRQKQIMDAAIMLISAKSIQAVTIKNIAEAVGVTEGAIYRHFKSKTDILSGILTIFRQKAEKTMETVCSIDAPAIEQIENIFKKHFAYFTQKPAITAVIFSESIFQNDSNLSQEVFKLLTLHEETLSCIIDRGHRTGEIDKSITKKELTRVIIGSIRYTVTKWRLSNYNFDLISEGELVFNCIKKILTNTPIRNK